MSKHKTPTRSAPVSPSSGERSGQADASLLDSIQSEVSKEASPLLEFLVVHARLIFLFLIGLILLIVAAGIWNYYSTGKIRDQEEFLGKILIRPETPAKLAELEQFAASTNPEARDAAFLALAQSATKQGEREKALWAWRQIGASGNAPLGFVAGIAEAEILGKQGKGAEGIARLEAMVSTASFAISPDERTMLSALMVELADQAGDWSKAAAICSEVLGGNDARPDRTIWEQRLAYYKSKM